MRLRGNQNNNDLILMWLFTVSMNDFIERFGEGQDQLASRLGHLLETSHITVG